MKLGKKRWWLVAFILALIILPVGFHFFQISREPRYEGKPVSYWFWEFHLSVFTVNAHHEQDDIVKALQAMGTNALPYLVKQALNPRKDTALRTNFYALLDKLPEAWHLPEFMSYDHIRDSAVEAIDEIEPLPDQILPLVQKALDGDNPLQQKQALAILSNVKVGRETFVPAFIKALRYPDHDARELAVDFFETAAPTQAAIPVLSQFFEQETNWWRRARLATGLCRMDSGQTNALNFLIEGLNKPWVHQNSNFCAVLTPEFQMIAGLNLVIPGRATEPPAAAFEQLALIGPNARAATPALLEYLGSTNLECAVAVEMVLKEMGVSTETCLPVLKKGMETGSEMMRAYCTVETFNLDHNDVQARSILLALVNEKSNLAILTVYRLAISKGSAKEAIPREAIPMLQEALTNKTEIFRNVAQMALSRIQAHEPSK